MAMTTLAQDIITHAFQAAETARTLQAQLNELNILYDADGGLKQTLIQSDLDSVPSFSGLTKAQLDDGLYVLTAVLRVDITNSYSQLVQLAARA